MSRLLLAVALAGCYTPRTAAQKPRALAYNALCVAAGLASFAAGYAIAREAPNVGDGQDDDSGLGGFVVGFVGGGGMMGGTFLVLGGLSGLAMTELGLSPTH